MYDSLYAAYLIYFNRDRDYFECHEVLEELWLAKDKDPRYKGLLQVAVSLYHFRNGNIPGASKMMRYAVSRLTGLADRELGIRMDMLYKEIEHYAAQLERYMEQPFPYRDLTILIADPLLQEQVERTAPKIQPNVPQRRGPQRSAKHELKHKQHGAE